MLTNPMPKRIFWIAIGAVVSITTFIDADILHNTNGIIMHIK